MLPTLYNTDWYDNSSMIATYNAREDCAPLVEIGEPCRRLHAPTVSEDYYEMPFHNQVPPPARTHLHTHPNDFQRPVSSQP